MAETEWRGQNFTADSSPCLPSKTGPRLLVPPLEGVPVLVSTPPRTLEAGVHIQQRSGKEVIPRRDDVRAERAGDEIGKVSSRLLLNLMHPSSPATDF